jgi:hypothetical protein
MKTTLITLIAILTLAGCATKLPVQVNGLTKHEDNPNGCYRAATLVESTLKKNGIKAKWVALPKAVTRTDNDFRGHAICVLEHEGKVWAYDSQFRGMTELKFKPSEVFNEKGDFIGDVVAIHKDARRRDFQTGSDWSQLGLDTRGLF